ATARSGFDGLWSVSIVTEAGPCERGLRYPVRIVGGAIRHAPEAGFTDFNLSGRVDQRGFVRVSVSRGEHNGQGSGRLSGNSGSGTWHSPTLGCSGTWSAERRN